MIRNLVRPFLVLSAALIRGCEHWARVKFTPAELEQLDTLRRTLGLAVDRKTEPGPQTTGQRLSA